MTKRMNRRNTIGKRIALAALAAGIGIAGSGCQTPGTGQGTEPYANPTLWLVKFDGRCPVDVVPANGKSCPPGKYKCVRVNSGHTVKFQADPLRYDEKKPDAYNTFVLHFDPFDENEIASGAGVVEKTTRRKKDATVKLEKPHTFVVTSKDAPANCDPVDPQIILD